MNNCAFQTTKKSEKRRISPWWSFLKGQLCRKCTIPTLEQIPHKMINEAKLEVSNIKSLINLFLCFDWGVEVDAVFFFDRSFLLSGCLFFKCRIIPFSNFTAVLKVQSNFGTIPLSLLFCPLLFPFPVLWCQYHHYRHISTIFFVVVVGYRHHYRHHNFYRVDFLFVIFWKLILEDTKSFRGG